MSDAPEKTTEPPSSSTPHIPLFQQLRDWLEEKFSKPENNIREALGEALDDVLEEHEGDGHASIHLEEKRMLQNLLDFGEMEVEDVMIHRPEVDAVPDDITLPDLRNRVLANGHSRMPVYHESLDEVVGLILTKDLIRFLGTDTPFTIQQILRPIVAVPPSMKVVDLLVHMRSSGSHMALVVDEFGGTDGIVTLEDLFEAIVGDIHDEHDDQEEADFIWLSPTEALADARIDLEELEEKLSLSLMPEEDEDEYDSLGGLICACLGHVPRKGETLAHRGVQFEIESADARRIHKVRIKRQAA